LRKQDVKTKKRRRGAERESEECFIQHLYFNYSPSVASVCEQFTHASELKKEKKKKRELCLAQPVQLGTVKKDE
jgi:hypothetical protein